MNNLRCDVISLLVTILRISWLSESRVQCHNIINDTCLQYTVFRVQARDVKIVTTGSVILNITVSQEQQCYRYCMITKKCKGCQMHYIPFHGFQCELLSTDLDDQGQVFREAENWTVHDTSPREQKVGPLCKSFSTNPCHPCRCFDTCNKTFRCLCDSDCKNTTLPLGMESGIIKDSQIRARSSYIEHFPEFHSPGQGRLNNKYCWCSGTPNQDSDEYFEINFERAIQFFAVATQGHPNYPAWITKYRLAFKWAYRNDFTLYKEDNRIKNFTGNSDQNSIVVHNLTHPVVANAMRLVVGKIVGNNACFRIEVYGCKF